MTSSPDLAAPPAPTLSHVARRAQPASPQSEALAQRLADPAIAGALASLLDHADLIAVLVHGLDQFVARSEVIGESLLESFADLRSTVDASGGTTGVDVTALARAASQLAQVIPKATPAVVAAVESGAIDKVLTSGVLEPAAIDQVTLLARGLVNAGVEYDRAAVPVAGPLSLMRALKDEDVQRALSYFLTMAKSIGHELHQPKGS